MRAPSRVVVLGSGAAGLAAALSASEAGADVLVLEASEFVGGTTAISGGVVWAPCNHLMTEAGIPDSEAEAIAYLDDIDRGGDPLLRTEFVLNAARVVSDLEDKTPLRFGLLGSWPDYHSEVRGGSTGGRSVWPLPIEVSPEVAARVQPSPEASDPGGDPSNDGVVFKGPVRGRALVGALLQELDSRKVEVRTKTRARRLVMRGDRVEGIEAENEPIEGRVVIATGGFQHDPQLAESFLRAPLIAALGPPGCSGDGLRMAMSAGALVGNMAEGWWMPAMHAPGEELNGSAFYRPLHSERAQPGCMMIDQTGKRFVNEAQNYGDVGRAMQTFRPEANWFPALPSWLVFDSRVRLSTSIGPLRPTDPDPEWLFKGADLAGLARSIGVGEGTFTSTVRRFNENASVGRDPDFGRGERHYDRWIGGATTGHPTLGEIRESPFYALRVECGCMGTKGGPRTDQFGRVVSARAGLVDGLYAAGNAAANPFGIATPAGGSTIGPALVFGARAGEAAATD